MKAKLRNELIDVVLNEANGVLVSFNLARFEDFVLLNSSFCCANRALGREWAIRLTARCADSGYERSGLTQSDVGAVGDGFQFADKI